MLRSYNLCILDTWNTQNKIGFYTGPLESYSVLAFFFFFCPTEIFWIIKKILMPKITRVNNSFLNDALVH